jgi:hypothetical protein
MACARHVTHCKSGIISTQVPPGGLGRTVLNASDSNKPKRLSEPSESKGANDTPPRIWRGLPIKTPHFAAADFEAGENSISNSTKPPGAKHQDHVDYRSILEALSHYGIPGWSSHIRDK